MPTVEATLVDALKLVGSLTPDHYRLIAELLIESIIDEEQKQESPQNAA